MLPWLASLCRAYRCSALQQTRNNSRCLPCLHMVPLLATHAASSAAQQPRAPRLAGTRRWSSACLHPQTCRLGCRPTSTTPLWCSSGAGSWGCLRAESCMRAESWDAQECDDRHHRQQAAHAMRMNGMAGITGGRLPITTQRLAACPASFAPCSNHIAASKFPFADGHGAACAVLPCCGRWCCVCCPLVLSSHHPASAVLCTGTASPAPATIADPNRLLALLLAAQVTRAACLEQRASCLWRN